MTSKQRAYLRGKSNKLDSIFQVGKQGVTPDLVKSIDEALEKRELIKINILNNCDLEIRECAEIVSGRTRSHVVQVIGKKFVLFRKSKSKPTIQF